MFGFYTPIILLQAFCIYHAYRNNSEMRWYWLIVLFPGVGCAVYLFYHFYNRRNISNVAETLKTVINSNYRIEQLEKAHRFSDTLANKINLADAYVDFGRYEDAITLYKESLSGFMSDDPVLRMKLLHAYFLNRNFQAAIEIGQILEQDSKFKNAEQRLDYAWSLHYLGNSPEAQSIFKSMNKSNTNFFHRKEYSRFLITSGDQAEAKNLLEEMAEEFEHMRGPERRLHRPIIQEVRGMLAKIEEQQRSSVASKSQ